MSNYCARSERRCDQTGHRLTVMYPMCVYKSNTLLFLSQTEMTGHRFCQLCCSGLKCADSSLYINWQKAYKFTTCSHSLLWDCKHLPVRQCFAKGLIHLKCFCQFVISESQMLVDFIWIVCNTPTKISEFSLSGTKFLQDFINCLPIKIRKA